MAEEFDIIKHKLAEFKKKYYLVLLTRGIFYFIALSVLWLTLVSALSFFNYLTVPVKTTIFYFSAFLYIAIFVFYILIPLLKLSGISKPISDKQAAKLISKHFKDLQDKLINTLELNEIKHSTAYSKELLEAAIKKRTEELKPIPFANAIDKKTVKTAAYVFAVTSVIFAAIYFSKPEIIKEGSKRIIKYDTYIAPPKPFKFMLLNDSLTVIKGKDITLEVQTVGKALPENVYVNIGGTRFITEKKGNGIFSYTIHNLNNDISVRFEAGNYYSKWFILKVIPAPVLVNMTVSVYPPSYTGIPPQTIQGNGDITAPEGSKIKWQFTLYQTDSVFIKTPSGKYGMKKINDKTFALEKHFFKTTPYTIEVSNRYIKHKKIAKYTVSVIKDKYPAIKITQYTDSLNPAVYFFNGTIKDDYGFSKLCFIYTYNDQTDTISLPFAENINPQAFEYSFDFSALKNATGTINYYFEVWDNDAINGFKSTRSITFSFAKPDKNKLDSIQTATQKEIEKKMLESQNLISEINREMEKLRQDKIKQNLSKWEKTKILENISRKQQELKNNIEQINRMYKQSENMSKAFSKQSEEIMKKQEEIEKLLEKVMDDEMKKLLDELAKLLEKDEQNKFEEKTKETEINLKELSEKLDRNLELLKRFEVERKIDKISKDLQDLAKEQEKLADKTAKTPKNDEKAKQELAKQQESLNKEFEKLMQEYNETMKKNSELKSPYKLDSFANQKQAIQQQMQQSSQQIQQGKNKKAAKSQKQSSQQMQQLAEQMQMMMQSQQMQQMTEDITALQQLAENINIFSMKEEALMKKFKTVSYRDGKIKDMIREQHNLKESFEVIKDSLLSISERIPQLANTITDELGKMQQKLEKTEDLLKDGRYRQAAVTQQFIMTSANNIDLLLSELIQAISQQMKSPNQSNSSCQKPGKKPGNTISQMQKSMQSLKQQLEKMINELKKQGKSGKNGKKINREIGKTIAEYEKFRRQLTELMNGDIHPQTMQQLNQINKLLEQNLNDLINNQINENLLRRQDKILVRLLEAENAERQRKTDNQRKAETTKDIINGNKKKFASYKILKQKFNDVIYKENIKLNKSYEEKYKQYIINLQEQ